MVTKDLIEIRAESTYTFTHFLEDKNQAVVPSNAYITILDSGADEILAQTAMTIDGTTGVCTYAWDSTGQDVGMNYQVKYELDSYAIVIRLFDIFLYPFVNNITDDDLITEYKGIRSGIYEYSGKIESGTINTLIDPNRNELDDYWNGGLLLIFKDQTILERKITDWVLSTNTYTFSPNIDIAINNGDYTVRKSFQTDILNAGYEVQLDFKKLEKRASLIIDSYTCKRLIIYKFFEKYFFELSKTTEDEYYLKYSYYSKKYMTERVSLRLVYDKNEDGIIDDDEVNATVGQIRWYR